MLHLNDIALPAAAVTLLNTYQGEVDAMPTFPERVAEAKRLFSLRNKRNNPAFREVRKNLAEMSGGTERCNYCEDSKGDEVEHIYPKNFYPEKCFQWTNYCYACGPCNGPKDNQFAVVETGTGNEVLIDKLPAGANIPSGYVLLINPRTEDPMEFLFLDIVNTFNFTPFKSGAKEKRRAEYTIDVLGLNSRSYLVKARKYAYLSYRARLREYVHKKDAGVSQVELDALIEAQKSDHHRTVWCEMKRQRSLIAEIDRLFNEAPEALTW
ncbi:hypothetical protein V9K67_22270 [Paraflavisolibacter sp. H34]|uniref:hypothetical protein n=1 Tax=Huijunlia imazamoxiresistens TaxID=3127457 RepID=UPI00301AA671